MVPHIFSFRDKFSLEENLPIATYDKKMHKQVILVVNWKILVIHCQKPQPQTTTKMIRFSPWAAIMAKSQHLVLVDKFSPSVCLVWSHSDFVSQDLPRETW